ncbi:hypothetical protein HDU97_007248 [Phlyctochytrium planicorne]|nr:hypothetical protein HDU97_007248 [Phlyctochytrium planicorne]
MTSIRAFGGLMKVPPELWSKILEYSGDWELSCKIEAILAALPSRFDDPVQALDTVDIPSTFPISCRVLKDNIEYLGIRKEELDFRTATVGKGSIVGGFQPTISSRGSNSNIFSIGFTYVSPSQSSKTNINPIEQNLTVLTASFVCKMMSTEQVKKLVWGTKNVDTLLSSAAGSVKILQIFHSYDPRLFDPCQQLIDTIARNNCIDSIKYVHSIGAYGFTNFTMNEAFWKGHLEMVQWIDAHKKFGPWEYAMDGVVETGRMEVMKWLFESEKEDFRMTRFDKALAHGHLEMAQWAAKNLSVFFDRFTSDGTDSAAMNGHLEAAKWAFYEMKKECTAKAMDGAASNGHFDVVKWLNEVNCKCTTKAMDGAAANGHMEILKWLHGNRTEGCSEKAMDEAAENGHLDVVKWLHENRSEGCSTEAMDMAAGNGHLEVVKWLHEQRSEGCTVAAMDAAAWNGHLEVVKWLYENRTEGCSAAAMGGAAGNGFLDVLDWLVENRKMACSDDAMASAAEHGHVSVLEWLLQRIDKANIISALKYALQECQTKAIEWMCESFDNMPMEYMLIKAYISDDLETLRFLMGVPNPNGWNVARLREELPRRSSGESIAQRKTRRWFTAMKQGVGAEVEEEGDGAGAEAGEQGAAEDSDEESHNEGDGRIDCGMM